jgi:putative peptide zinc metalloprotease protein
MTTLPALREELCLHAGPAAADGAPTWTLQDPVTNRFFRIDWPTFLILSHWHAGNPECIAEQVSTEGPIDIDGQDVAGVLDFLARSELLQCTTSADTQRLHRAGAARRQSAWAWLLHHYLFFRLPLWRPDRWLARMAPVVDVLFGPTFRRLTLLALALGGLGVLRQWEHFSTTLVDTLNWNGAKAYLAVLVGVKFLHELGHAFTAKRLGCRVPTMGVAFLVMWPVAYTDVNDAWKLPRRQDRLKVGAAGVLTELVIAAWATLAWALLPDGGARSAAFLLATTTWIATVAINASPFLRFDGYFLLSDWLDTPNLHTRAFALARWKMRELLFALGEDKPECLPANRERFLIGFAWLTWGYRLVLFLGIALLVYNYFFKLLGVFLFAVEIAWFILMPFKNEFGEWHKRWPQIRKSARGRRWLLGAGVLLVAGVLPLGTTIESQGLLKPERSHAVFSPAAARLESSLPPHGTSIKAGTPLVILGSPELEARARAIAARSARIIRQLEIAAVNPDMHADLPLLREESRRLAEEAQGNTAEQARLTPTAPFDGLWVDPQTDLHQGDWIGKSAQLATLVDPARWRVDTYLEEQEVGRIRVGDSARFFPETAGMSGVALRVTAIDSDTAHELADAPLATLHGGRILVRQQDHRLLTERAMFRVSLEADTPPAGLHVTRGMVSIQARGESLLGRYLRSATGVLIRESGW